MRPNDWGYLSFDRYEGKINRWGLPHGEGIQYRANGSVIFKGEFKTGLRDGPGIEYRGSKRERFEGMWKWGQLHGLGTYYEAHGSIWLQREFEATPEIDLNRSRSAYS